MGHFSDNVVYCGFNHDSQSTINTVAACSVLLNQQFVHKSKKKLEITTADNAVYVFDFDNGVLVSAKHKPAPLENEDFWEWKMKGYEDCNVSKFVYFFDENDSYCGQPYLTIGLKG